MAAATSSSTSGLQQLSLSPALFQKVDPPLFLFRHLTSPNQLRPSRRTPTQARQPTLNTSPLSHAHGSAVVRAGDTAVVCGVRAEILPLVAQGASPIVLQRNSELEHERGASAEERDREVICENGLIVPNLELGTGCKAGAVPGPPGDYAQSVAARWRGWLVDILRPVPLATLEIRGNGEGEGGEGVVKAYWVLYIDVMCISLDGGLLEVGFAAIMAALRNCWVPVAKWDEDAQGVVCEGARKRPLELRPGGLGFAAGYAVFRSKEEAEGDDAVVDETQPGEEVRERRWVLADPDDFEEGVCEERVVVLRRENGRIAKVEMGGGKGGEEILAECLRRSKERVQVWKKLVCGEDRME